MRKRFTNNRSCDTERARSFGKSQTTFQSSDHYLRQFNIAGNNDFGFTQAEIFVGNDSGIAHIAAAVETPGVVIFGSSNINHWRPWTNAHYEIAYKKLPCQPCAGYFCKEFDAPECILSVDVKSVLEKIDKVLDIK